MSGEAGGRVATGSAGRASAPAASAVPAGGAAPADGAAPAPLASRLELLAAAALFSTGGAAVKATALSGWQVAGFRAVVAIVAMLAMMPAARRRPTPRLLALSVAYASTMVLYILANKLTTAAATIFLQATAPLYLLLLGPWLLRERIGRRDLGFMAAVALGLALLFAGLDPASATAPRPLVGDLLAAGSGLAWALTLVGLRALERDPAEHGGVERGPAGGGSVGPSPAEPGPAERGTAAATAGKPPGALAGSGPVALVWGNATAAAAALPMALAAGLPLSASRPRDWLIVLYLGVFQVALAYVFLNRGIGRVRALEASLLLMLEPVLNPVWAWLVHGERPGRWSLAGGAVILAATVVKGWLDARQRRIPPREAAAVVAAGPG
jgi:DME family drug/metabolite transporter